MVLQAQQESEDRQYQEQLEQERQDHELALRLAQENNENLEDSPPLSRKYAATLIADYFRISQVQNHCLQNRTIIIRDSLKRFKFK